MRNRRRKVVVEMGEYIRGHRVPERVPPKGRLARALGAVLPKGSPERWKRGKRASCLRALTSPEADMSPEADVSPRATVGPEADVSPEAVCRCRETTAGEMAVNVWTCSWASTEDTRPKCLRCGRNEFLTRIPYGSVHDGDYICSMCFDELLCEDVK